MAEQQVGERCACADALNFGEPQPDCSRCDGSGTVKAPEVSVGPVFDMEEHVDFMRGIDRSVAGLKEQAERKLAELTPKERAIVEKRFGKGDKVTK